MLEFRVWNVGHHIENVVLIMTKQNQNETALHRPASHNFAVGVGELPDPLTISNAEVSCLETERGQLPGNGERDIWMLGYAKW